MPNLQFLIPLDFELLKTIAAFGGFLGAVTQIYDKFIAKPKLVVDIEYSGLRHKGDSVLLKVDLSLFALGGDVSLKEVYLFNKDNSWKEKELYFSSLNYHLSGTGSWNLMIQSPIKRIFLDKAIKGQRLFYTGDITKLSWDTLDEQFIDQWSSTQDKDWEENIRGLKITKYSRILLTFVAKLSFLENQKNSIQIPDRGWHICFDYGIGKVKKKIFVSN